MATAKNYHTLKCFLLLLLSFIFIKRKKKATKMPDQQKEIPDSPNLRGTIHLEKKKKVLQKGS